MKLAILSGANPEKFEGNAVIRLIPGSWRFHVHGVIDSELTVNVEGYEHCYSVKDHQVFDFVEPVNIKPYFSKVGTEKSITVIAERINGVRNI